MRSHARLLLSCQRFAPGQARSGAGTSGIAAAAPSTGRYSRATEVPFLEMRTSDFSNLSGGAQEFIVLHPKLCVLDYYRVRIAVRVHALSMSATQGLRFILNGALPSEEDPALDFVSTTDS